MSALPSDDMAWEPNPLTAMVEVVEHAPRGKSRVSGREFYIIPSRTEAQRAHWTTSYGCTCKGYFHRGKCIHVDAVRALESLNAGCD